MTCGQGCPPWTLSLSPLAPRGLGLHALSSPFQSKAACCKLQIEHTFQMFHVSLGLYRWELSVGLPFWTAGSFAALVYLSLHLLDNRPVS